jgi:hypothetical protein
MLSKNKINKNYKKTELINKNVVKAKQNKLDYYKGTKL